MKIEKKLNKIFEDISDIKLDLEQNQEDIDNNFEIEKYLRDF
jgi:hypothetical protein